MFSRGNAAVASGFARRKLGVVVDVHRMIIDNGQRSTAIFNSLHKSLELVLRAYSAVPAAMFEGAAGGSPNDDEGKGVDTSIAVKAAAVKPYDIPQVVCVLSPDPIDAARLATTYLSSVLSELNIPCLPSHRQYQYNQHALATKFEIPHTSLTRSMKRCDVMDCVVDELEATCDNIALLTNSPFLQLHFSTLPGCRPQTAKPIHIFSSPDTNDLSRVIRVDCPSSAKYRADIPPQILRDYLVLSGLHYQGVAGASVPGAPTVGMVWAKNLLMRFGSIEEILRCAESASQLSVLDESTRKRVLKIAEAAKKLKDETAMFRPNKKFFLRFISNTMSVPQATAPQVIRSMLSVAPKFTETDATKVHGRYMIPLMGTGALNASYKLAQKAVGTPSTTSLVELLRSEVNPRDTSAVTRKFDEILNAQSIDIGVLESLLAAFPNGRPSYAQGWCANSIASVRKAAQTQQTPKEINWATVLSGVQFGIVLLDCSSAILRQAEPTQTFRRIVTLMRDVTAGYQPLTYGSNSEQQPTLTVPVVIPVLNPNLGKKGAEISQLLHGFGIPAIPRPRDFERITPSIDCRLRDVLEFLRHGVAQRVMIGEKSATELFLVVQDGEPHVNRGQGSVVSTQVEANGTLSLVPCTLAGNRHGLDAETYRWFKSASRVPSVAEKITTMRLRALFERFGSYGNLLVAYEETKGKKGRRASSRYARDQSTEKTSLDQLRMVALAERTKLTGSPVDDCAPVPSMPKTEAPKPTGAGGYSQLCKDTIERLTIVGENSKAIQDVYIRNIPDPQAFAAIAGSSAELDELFTIINGFAEELVASAITKSTVKSDDGAAGPRTEEATEWNRSRVETYLSDLFAQSRCEKSYA